MGMGIPEFVEYPPRVNFTLRFAFNVYNGASATDFQHGMPDRSIPESFTNENYRAFPWTNRRPLVCRRMAVSEYSRGAERAN